MVFQWPWGALATSRSPLGAQPRKRLHVGLRPGLVDEHQALGVDPALPLRPLRPPPRDVRPIALAGDHEFFEAELLSVNEIPHRAIIDLKTALGEFDHQSAQGEGPLPDTPRQKGRMLAAIALGLCSAHLARRDAAGLPKPPHPIDHRARRDPEPRRRLVARQPVLAKPPRPHAHEDPSNKAFPSMLASFQPAR